MIILEHPLPEMLSYLGNNTSKTGKKYRFNRFCIITQETRGRKLIFNDLTKAFVMLESDEYDEIVNTHTSHIDFLYLSWFLVEEDFDEESLVEEFRSYWFAQKTTNIQHPVNYTILPTTACNARCFYCYEDRSIKKVMKTQTALDVAHYIVKHSGGIHPVVSLRWFGGEPTCNIKAIDTICNELSKLNINYVSDMTSNSYLLSGETVKKAKELWHLQSVQITIDGTEKVYNETKNYIYKDVNPFEQLMNNIGELLNIGIICDIRLNIDHHNAEDIMDLLDDMKQRFGKPSNLYFYAMPLFECAMDKPRTEEERDKVYEWVTKVQIKLETLGYWRADLKRTLPTAMCMADDGKSVLINPEGKIGLCEHHIDDDFIGSIYDTNFDYKRLSEWDEKLGKLEICNDCPFYAHCVKLVHCIEQGKCYKQERDCNIESFKRKMHYYFINAQTTPYYMQQLNEQMYGVQQNNNTSQSITNVSALVSSSAFAGIKYGKELYIFLNMANLKEYGAPTPELLVDMLRDNFNIGIKYNIKPEDITIGEVDGIFENNKLYFFSINMRAYPGMRNEESLSWKHFTLYEGDINVPAGETSIVQWI